MSNLEFMRRNKFGVYLVRNSDRDPNWAMSRIAS